MFHIHKKFVVVVMMAGLTATGCSGLSGVRVVKHPDDYDTGIRYYRPKPYLLVTPADPTGRMVNLKLEYLPDYAEEYSVQVRGKAAVALKDGWNLVELTTKGSPPPPPPPAEKDAPPPPAPGAPPVLPQAVVAATNVPMGYYESVYEYIGQTKYFKAWRYIGFTVLGPTRPGICRLPESAGAGAQGGRGGANCAVHGGGGSGAGNLPGECINGPLYGIVFFNGVMTFRQLEEIANNQLCPTFVNPAPGYTPPQTEVIEEKRSGSATTTVIQPAGTADVRPGVTPPAPAPVPPPPSTLDSTPPPAPMPPTPAPTTPPPGASTTRKPKAGMSSKIVLDLPPLPPGL